MGARKGYIASAREAFFCGPSAAATFFALAVTAALQRSYS
jgi:hypothetical protein